MKKLLMVFPLVFLLCFTFSCQQDEEAAEEATGEGICRVLDGKIVEWWMESDYLSLMQQFGMELKPKEGEK